MSFPGLLCAASRVPDIVRQGAAGGEKKERKKEKKTAHGV
jgi:hypothetical protein